MKNTSIRGLRDHFPVICTRLEVGDCFPAITSDSCFVISPEFPENQKGRCVGRHPIEVENVGWVIKIQVFESVIHDH